MKRLLTCILVLLGIGLNSNAQMFCGGAVASSQQESTAAQRFITITGITDATQKAAIVRLVQDLTGISNGSYTTSNIWFRFNAIYPFIGGTSSACSYNLKNPANFQLTFINSPTFDATGMVGGTTTYAKTGLVPSTSMALNDTHISVSTSGTINNQSVADISSQNSALQRMNIFLRLSTDLCISDMYNTSARAQVANSSSTGFYAIASRTATSFDIYRDGVSVASHGGTGGTLPSFDIVIGGDNNNGTYTAIGTARTYKFATIGRGLTSAQVQNLYDAEHFFNVTTLSR